MPVPVVSLFLTAVSVPSAARPACRSPMTRCTSVRSTSVKVMVPLSVRLPAGGDLLGDRAMVLRGDHRRIVGAGDGDVDLLVIRPPLLSSSVMVKLSTLVWPAARNSTAESATV